MSIADLLEEASKHVVLPSECHTVFCLNSEGRRAKASQPIARVVHCPSKSFVWSEDDQGFICEFCWTPRQSKQAMIALARKELAR